MGVNRAREREYMDVARAWGDSDSMDRKDSGRASVEEGGEVYSVDSSVIRRMSHFRRWSDSKSGAVLGGFSIAKADCKREYVRAMSR